jgi:hypothetical protein
VLLLAFNLGASNAALPSNNSLRRFKIVFLLHILKILSLAIRKLYLLYKKRYYRKLRQLKGLKLKYKYATTNKKRAKRLFKDVYRTR